MGQAGHWDGGRLSEGTVLEKGVLRFTRSDTYGRFMDAFENIFMDIYSVSFSSCSTSFISSLVCHYNAPSNPCVHGTTRGHGECAVPSSCAFGVVEEREKGGGGGGRKENYRKQKKETNTEGV